MYPNKFNKNQYKNYFNDLYLFTVKYNKRKIISEVKYLHYRKLFSVIINNYIH